MSRLFSKHIKTDTVSFKYARGLSDRNGKEFHPFYEIILFLGGEAQLISDKMNIRLNPGDIIFIPKECYHQLIVTGSQEEYFRCVINFLGDKSLEPFFEDLNEITFMKIESETKHLFDKLIGFTESTFCDAVKGELLNACLVLILEKLSGFAKMPAYPKNSELMSKCIAYISDNLCGGISVPDIAHNLNVSVSTLTHSFKNEMQIPIHQYIIKKRLMLAHQKILNGEPATSVAVECGFSDYSGFYKQYKKMFNTAPSSTVYILG